MRRALPVVALLLTACVAVEGFDPTGDQAAIYGGWTIDGQPASGSLCEQMGATRVRVTFLDDRRPVPHSGLFFQCQVGDFDTRGVGGAVVGAGRWTVRLDALNGNGDLLAAGTASEMPVEILEGMYDPETQLPVIEVPTANFFSATVSASYRLQGQDPSQERCDALGVATVGLVFEDLGAGGMVTTTAPEPCALGVVGTRILPGFTYSVRLRAFDAAGVTVLETPAQSVAPTTGQDIELDAGGPLNLGP